MEFRIKNKVATDLACHLFEVFDVGTYCRNVPIRYGKYGVTGLTRLTAPGRRFIFPVIDTTASGDHFFRTIPALPSRFATVFVPLHVLLPERTKHRRTCGRLRKSRPPVSSVSETRQAAMRNQIQPELGLAHQIVRATVGRRGYIAQKACERINMKRCRGSRGTRLWGTPRRQIHLYGLPSRQPWRSAASLAKSAKETLPLSDKTALTKFFG